MFVYWAAPGFRDDLRGEIARASNLTLLDERDDLMFATGIYQPMAWASSTWRHAEILSFKSIREAAQALRDKGPLWTSRSSSLHRRTQLIRGQLRRVKNKPREFSREALPSAPLGAFTLLSEDELLWSNQIWPKLIGDLEFKETKEPPSRAYLKLWEILTLTEMFPEPGARCLEIGASPGGWTWVLQKLGCDVWAIDRAELAPVLMKSPFVHFRKGDAFSIKPDSVPPMDWLFSDIICYPEKLYEWLQPWLQIHPAINFVCTLKFKGRTDFDTMDLFRAIPGSILLHLSQNKHEVTWCRFREPVKNSSFLLPP